MIGLGGVVIAAVLFYVVRAASRIWSGASRAFRRSRPVSFDGVTGSLRRLLEDGHDGGVVVIACPS
jgi:hypothetical protein